MDKQKFWDPLGEVIDIHSYEIQKEKHLKSLTYYQNDPNRINDVTVKLAIIPVVVILFFLLITHDAPIGFIIWCIAISFFPVGIYRFTISNLQQNLALLLMCQKQNWVFYSEDEPKRMKMLEERYPHQFVHGHSRTIADQIWGHDETGKTSFWRTTFRYVTGSGKNRSTHYKSIYMLPLPKNIETSFILSRRLVAVFEHKIKTESEEFNKMYSIKADAESSTEMARILKVLSPSVQVRLIDVARLSRLQSISFLNNAIVFEFNSDDLNLSYTNFSKKVEIDPRDVGNLTSLIHSLVAVPNELLSFID
ncbi:hypothetical protein KBD81_02350 [Candidatus Woesebacteria bacterium]|nr:hypothetical protein [Candidatus Woesebacteria bacterium]